MEDRWALAIRAPAPPKQGVVHARWGSDMAIEPLPVDALSNLHQCRQRIIGALAQREERPSPKELTGFGHELFSFLFRVDLKKLYGRVAPAPSHTHVQIRT